MVLTMAAVAEHKDIKPEKLEVHIARQTTQGAPWRTRFVAYIDLGKGLTHRERAILFNSARRCEVHQLLTGEMTFEFQLEDSETKA
jgi:uncharacterized OsmC-like protein